ncbi:DUF3617 domain-containing protein [Qipengyuania zhejiangensis]|uniref:DUF3617 domain-containing protein n=1 Tax=Qipengyuania zhejiangensis TaxID=3077782 RepID=UPI002D7908ED|nr:DUF3617 domain-containing protein [Qipengyuania sp. Z2]
MRMIFLAGAAALSLSACGSDGADADGDGTISNEEVAEAARDMVKPLAGQYRATTELVSFEAPGAPPEAVEMMRGAMSRSFEYCMSQEDADKGFEEMARESQDDSCKFEKFDVDGGSIDAVMACSGGSGEEMRMTMQGNGTPTGSDMTMTMQGTIPGQGEGKMVMNTKHERIGDCDASVTN